MNKSSFKNAYDKNSIQRNFRTANSFYVKISVRQNIRTAKFPTANFPYGEIFLRCNFLMAKFCTVKFLRRNFPRRKFLTTKFLNAGCFNWFPRSHPNLDSLNAAIQSSWSKLDEEVVQRSGIFWESP